MAVGQSPAGGGHAGRLLTMGEALGLLTAHGTAPLRAGSRFELGVAGAEVNVAIGVSRLGGDAAWLGRVGDDEIGSLVSATLHDEGVDTGGVIVEADRPTSLLMRGPPLGGVRRPSYYRVQGPGARLQPTDLPDHRIATASVVHVTGITPALSESAYATVRAVMTRAREMDVAVTLDVNYRPALWSPDEARPVLEDLAGLAGHVFVGEDEAKAVGWDGDPRSLGAGLASLGAGVVIVKQAAEGATAIHDGRLIHTAAAPTRCVDLHGAGDAFAAGYIAELMRGEPLHARLATGVACAGCVIARPGDWEGFPTRSQLRASGLEASAP